VSGGELEMRRWGGERGRGGWGGVERGTAEVGEIVCVDIF